jgi:hypothetical protein
VTVILIVYGNVQQQMSLLKIKVNVHIAQKENDPELITVLSEEMENQNYFSTKMIYSFYDCYQIPFIFYDNSF